MPMPIAPLRRASWVPSIAVLLGLGFSLFTNSGPDDTHITYWPALELLRHGRIENYNGDPIEQSSSLAHVLLTAAVAKLTGLHVTTAGHSVAIAAGVLCLPLTYLLALRVVPRCSRAVPWFVATTGPFLDWTFGGLEAPLFALSMLLTALSAASLLARPTWRRWGWCTAAMLFMEASRPEAILLLGCVVGAMFVISMLRRSKPEQSFSSRASPELRLACAAALASALVVCAHLAIGKHPFPNPVRAKAHGLDLDGGLHYLAGAIGWRWLWALALFGVGVKIVAGRATKISRARGATEQVVALLALGYLGFIATVGGDWMWGARMLAHVAPLFCLVVVVGAVRVVPRRFRGWPLTLALVAGNYLPFVALAQGSRTGRPVWEVPKMRALVHERYPNSTYEWPELASGVSIRDIPVAEELRVVITRLAPLVAPGPVVVASRQAGFTIFHTLVADHPDVRFIDLHNLSTDDFLPCGGEFLRRETHGALLPFRMLVNPPARLKEVCPIVRPHVFFDVPRNAEPADAQRFGYEIVWKQRGRRGGSEWTNGHSAIFIAVDSKLASRAGLDPETLDPIDYDEVTTATIMRHL